MIMKGIRLFLLAQLLFFKCFLFAGTPPDEGMWLPLLLKDYNYEEMQRLGLKLTAEQIYSVNNASLKDAIVQLGGFCTAEIISEEGLLLTNHHCGYDAIASQSTEEHNYLDDGFWAMNHGEELPIEGLYVRFLVRMEDLTEQLENVRSNNEPGDQELAVLEKISEFETKFSENGKYTCEVKEMFDGNAYYAFVYEVYSDIRLVGAPPSSIGKFGGDTDNWMWPRHTGDFSMFRIYANSNNEPAAYSSSNVPFKPKHALPVSTGGIEDGDFTMVLGYPGSTTRYLTSPEINDVQMNEAPIMVKVLEDRLAVMKTAMDKSEKVRIAYASNYASLANTYKYYKGQLRGLNKFDQISKQKIYEEQLMNWVNKDADLKAEYGDLIGEIAQIYKDNQGVTADMAYLNLAAFAPEFVATGFGIQLYRLRRQLENEREYDDISHAIMETAPEFFANYVRDMDRDMLIVALKHLHEMSANRQIDLFESDLYLKKCKGSDERFADLVMSKSMLTNESLLNKFLSKPKLNTLDKDPGMVYVLSVIQLLRSKLMAASAQQGGNLEVAREKYMKLLQLKETRNFYPDANFTMRVTYGTVKNYQGWDGEAFNTFTYASEILDKYKAGDAEFDVPEKLRTLIKNKDFGAYGNDDRTLNVCFLHNTDITGGNSGSPVINGDGALIGCAFDGNWESMTSDIFWQDEYVRTISVDIRYVLFIIDKFAGAGHLVEEMNLVD